MPEPPTMRWRVMLNQARAFAEQNPHDAVGRVDEVLHEIDAHIQREPSATLALRDLRNRAQALRVRCAQAYERFQAASARRSLEYQARIGRENSGPGHA